MDNCELVPQQDMCYFITVGLPRQTAQKLLRTLPGQMQACAAENKSVAKHLPPTHLTFYVITAMCSCDLFRPGGEPPEDEEKRLRKKYEDRGWRSAKIERALADHARVRDTRRKSFIGIRPDLGRWLADVASRSGTDVYVLVHMYSGDQNTEEVVLRGQEMVTPASPNFAAQILEDRLIKIAGASTI